MGRMYHKWSDAETRKLVGMARRYNEDWEMIQRLFFPGFTTLQLKNKYAATVRNGQIVRKERPAPPPAESKNYSAESERQVRLDTSIVHAARRRNYSMDT